jgi:hypothetical protein
MWVVIVLVELAVQHHQEVMVDLVLRVQALLVEQILAAVAVAAVKVAVA